MFSLIPDLKSIVCEFAWDASLEETRESLKYVLFVNKLNLHPYCLTTWVEDHTDANGLSYSRLLRHSFTRSWLTPKCESPLREFFVWFAKSAIFDYARIAHLLSDCDWRTIRPLLKDSGARSRAGLLDEVESTMYGLLRVSKLFDGLQIHNLKMRPTPLSRQLIASRNPSFPLE